MIELDKLTVKEIFPGFHGKLIHTDQMTLAYWDIAEGCELPEHSHHHEQVVNLLDGKFEITIGGVTHLMTKGSVLPIPSNVKHSGKAITDCHILDVFTPVREDYL